MTDKISVFQDPDLDDIVYAGTPTTEEEFRAAQAVLNVRLEVLRRVFARKEYAGRAKRHRAMVLRCEKAMEGKTLDEARQMELEGQIEIAKAKEAECMARIRQCGLEIDLWMSTKRGES